MLGLNRGSFISIASAVLLLMCLSANADARIRFDLPAQPLATSLAAVGNLAHLNVLFDSALVDDLQAPAINAELSADEALAQLLVGTRLRIIRVNKNTLTLVAMSPDTAAAGEGNPDSSNIHGSENLHLSALSTGDDRTDVSAGGSRERDANMEKKVSAGSAERNPESRQLQFSEVVVTAQKRSERLEDVPVPVTAIRADELVSNNQVRLQDYYTSVPSLTLTPNVASNQVLSIRGITTGNGTNPTVGITVDDVPFGSSTNSGGGLVVPDFDPGDLARVEVLRGPQGTLYGASSMGGLLKFVTLDPSTSDFRGQVQAGTESIRNGSGLGYTVRGSVNVPVSDSVAIRASAFDRRDPGYIDNPVLGIDGINEARASGGRLSALWRAGEDLSIKLSAFYQNLRGDGLNDVNMAINGYTGAPLGDLQQNYARGVGPYDRKSQAYSATVAAKAGTFDLTSISGYNINSFTDSWDYSFGLSSTVQPLFGVTGAPVFDDNRTTKFTQELRASTPIGPYLDWLLGAFYTRERSTFVQRILASDPLTGAEAAEFGRVSFPTTYDEYAGFTDVTVRITRLFDIQLGARESHIKQTYSEVDSGAYTEAFYFLPSPIVYPERETTANAFTYLVTPRLKLTQDVLLYARLASGYRAGGTNTSPGDPPTFSPDKTINYEVGTKAGFLDHRIYVDASLYYIDWKNIQVQLIDPATFLSYTTNGSRAKSQGVELSAQTQPLRGLTVGAWATWDDAVLTRDFPPNSSVFGFSGDRLPYSSRFSANVSVRQDFPLSAQLTGFVGADVSYIGNRMGVFASVFGSPERQTFPAYTKTDLRIGAKLQSWTLNVFANNVADRRGVLTGGLGAYPPFAFIYIQPRTIGLTLTKEFEGR